MNDFNLADPNTLAKAIHQVYNTNNNAERNTIQTQLEAVCK